MARATFRFYAELNDFLPRERRGTESTFDFRGAPSVKDSIEALGVPHPEVDLVLVNGRSVGFGHPLQDGDRVSVYPVFESLDVAGVTRLRKEPLRETRFVADVHLGRLAAYLRLAGFDVRYDRALGDEALARISATEHRILLTRDVGLLKRSMVTHGYWVRSTEPRRQLVEVVERLQLGGRLRPFGRCMRCNTPLERVAKEAIVERLPRLVREGYHEFLRCPGCERLYWKGTHYEKLMELVSSVTTGDGGGHG